MALHRKNVPMEELVPLLQLQMETGGSARLIVTGYSMMPMLRNRKDSVMLALPSGKEKKGDVILYRRGNGAYVLHRIIGKATDGYICCGDNQYMCEPVSAEQVIGVVTAFCRNGIKCGVQKWTYRLYVMLWAGLFPLRGVYISARRCLGRLCRSLRRRK